MLPCLKAIIRDTLPGLDIVPGSVVHVAEAILEAPDGAKFPAILDRDSNYVLRLSRSEILPCSQFLTRQPFLEFWIVAHIRSWHTKPNCFLSDPRRETMGPKPYRFESIGEVRYYLKQRNMNITKFLISKMGKLP